MPGTLRLYVTTMFIAGANEINYSQRDCCVTLDRSYRAIIERSRNDVGLLDSIRTERRGLFPLFLPGNSCVRFSFRAKKVPEKKTEEDTAERKRERTLTACTNFSSGFLFGPFRPTRRTNLGDSKAKVFRARQPRHNLTFGTIVVPAPEFRVRVARRIAEKRV